jgi:hypothetical protein
MAGGLIGLGRQGYLNQSQAGFGQAANLEHQRNQANRQIEQAEQQQTMSAIGQGAGTGAMIGSAVPGVGTLAGAGIGAGVGLLVSEVF